MLISSIDRLKDFNCMAVTISNTEPILDNVKWATQQDVISVTT